MKYIFFVLCSLGWRVAFRQVRPAATICVMTESELAKVLAKRLKTSHCEAADRVGRQIHEIVRQLRSGISVTIPGLGTLLPGRSAQKTVLRPVGTAKLGKRS